MRRLTDFRVLTFDCYGTLIDWECGIWDALQPLIMRNPGLCASGVTTRYACVRPMRECVKSGPRPA